jgi:hypothetical protein
MSSTYKQAVLHFKQACAPTRARPVLILVEEAANELDKGEQRSGW